MSILDTKNKGWALVPPCRKSHYYVETRSLCGRWVFFGEITYHDYGLGDDDCVACTRKLSKLKEKQ